MLHLEIKKNGSTSKYVIKCVLRKKWILCKNICFLLYFWSRSIECSYYFSCKLEKTQVRDSLTSRALCNKRKEKKIYISQKKHAIHATSYTYKLNVAYFIIPKVFWYSEAPCTTSTICHLKTSSFRVVCRRNIAISLLCRLYACS